MGVSGIEQGKGDEQPRMVAPRAPIVAVLDESMNRRVTILAPIPVAK